MGLGCEDGRVTLIEPERLTVAATVSTRERPLVGPYSDAGLLAIGYGSLWYASGDGRSRASIHAQAALRRGSATWKPASRTARSPRAPDPYGWQGRSGVAPHPHRSSEERGAGEDPGPEVPVRWRRRGRRPRLGRRPRERSGLARRPAEKHPGRDHHRLARAVGSRAGHGSVWVANSGDGTVSRIDPVSGRVIATIDVGGSPTGLAVADDGVWVTVAS